MANEPACPPPRGLPCMRVLSAASLGLLAFPAGTWGGGREGWLQDKGQVTASPAVLPPASAEIRLQAQALSIPPAASQQPRGTCSGPHPSQLQSIPRRWGWAQR